MKRKEFGWMLAILMSAMMMACSIGAPSLNQEVTQPTAATQAATRHQFETAMDSKTTSVASSSSALGGKLKPGMAYADFRELVLGQGWSPVVDPQCKVNVVGSDYKRQCEADPAMCRECNEMPELSACSGDGHCLMYFHHADTGRDLEVSSYGMIEDWNISGDDSRLSVTEWAIIPTTAR